MNLKTKDIIKFKKTIETSWIYPKMKLVKGTIVQITYAPEKYALWCLKILNNKKFNKNNIDNAFQNPKYYYNIKGYDILKSDILDDKIVEKIYLDTIDYLTLTY